MRFIPWKIVKKTSKHENDCKKRAKELTKANLEVHKELTKKRFELYKMNKLINELKEARDNLLELN